MNALIWLGGGAEDAINSRMNRKIPVLRRAEAQAEAGPLIPMMRRENMELSIAAGGGNRKGRAGVDPDTVADFIKNTNLLIIGDNS